MKKLIKNLMFIFFLSPLFPSMVNANCCYDDFFDYLCPYAGLEAKWQNLHGRSYWSRVLPPSTAGGSVFLGSRFMEYAGLELGYTDLFTRTRRHVFVPGEEFFGVQNTGSLETMISDRFSSGYVDLNGYYPCLDGCLDFIGSLGVSSMEPHVNVVVTNAGPLPTDDARRLERIKGAQRTVFRVGAGAQYMFCDCVGLRGMVRFENTSALRFRIPERDFAAPFNTDLLKRPFKDTVSLAFGVFAAF